MSLLAFMMSVQKWWNEICGREKREKPREKPTLTPFVHHETRTRDPSCGRRAFTISFIEGVTRTSRIGHGDTGDMTEND